MSIGVARLAPTGVTSRRSSAVSNLGWRWSGRLPISSRNTVPPLPAWSRPMRSALASVNAPFTWPNSSDSNRLSVTAPRSTETIGSVAAPRPAMQFARDQLLAGAVFAENQDIGVGRRGALDQRIDPPHRGGFAQQGNVADRGADFDRAAALGLGGALRGAQRGRAADRRHQPLVRPGLGHEIGRAALDRVDRDGQPAVRGDDDDRRVGVLVENPRQPAKPFGAVGRAALEIEVEQDDVGLGRVEIGQQLFRDVLSATISRNCPRKASRAASAMSGSSSTTTARSKS